MGDHLVIAGTVSKLMPMSQTKQRLVNNKNLITNLKYPFFNIIKDLQPVWRGAEKLSAKPKKKWIFFFSIHFFNDKEKA